MKLYCLVAWTVHCYYCLYSIFSANPVRRFEELRGGRNRGENVRYYIYQFGFLINEHNNKRMEQSPVVPKDVMFKYFKYFRNPFYRSDLTMASVFRLLDSCFGPFSFTRGREGEVVLNYRGSGGTCGPKGYGISAVLVRNNSRVQFWPFWYRKSYFLYTLVLN